MRVDIEDDDLKKLFGEPDFRISGFGPELTRSCRKVLNAIDAADDERDLRSMRSLHFEKLAGRLAGKYSLQLHGGFRLIFRLEEDGGTKTIVVEGVTDYH